MISQIHLSKYTSFEYFITPQAVQFLGLHQDVRNHNKSF